MSREERDASAAKQRYLQTTERAVMPTERIRPPSSTRGTVIATIPDLTRHCRDYGNLAEFGAEGLIVLNESPQRLIHLERCGMVIAQGGREQLDGTAKAGSGSTHAFLLRKDSTQDSGRMLRID